MSNLFSIYNENFGENVVTNGKFIAVSNTNSKNYSCEENFARVGEVNIYRKDDFTTNYSLDRVYKRPQYAVPVYYTEQYPTQWQSSSLSPEQSGSSVDTTSSFDCCGIFEIDSDPAVYKQTKYGSALSICDRYLAISDVAVSQSLNYVDSIFASVDVFNLYNQSNTGSCVEQNDSIFQLPDYPFSRITGSVDGKFGYSVSVTDNYLAISEPYYDSTNGVVYIYKLTSGSYACGYELMHTIYAPISNSYFGSDLYLDKVNENKLVVANGLSIDNKVYLYHLINDTWVLKQTLSQDTSHKWFRLKNGDVYENTAWYPTSVSSSKYGYSVAIAGRHLVIGAPEDLTYYEYSSSNEALPLRRRGSIYSYHLPTSSADFQFVLREKLYGDVNTFKDNMLGYDVDVTSKHVLAGSPKIYSPFSSLYLSESIGRYNVNFQPNDFGASTFNGQSLLYNIITSSCDDTFDLQMATTAPIAYRKRTDESYSAFGLSVGLSDENLVIGSPIPLNDDLHLQTPYSFEQSSSGIYTCGTADSVSASFIRMEDLICVCSDGHDLNSQVSGSVVLIQEGPEIEQLYGKSFIYDFADLQRDSYVGNIFYNNNRFIVNNTGSVLKDLLKDPSDNYKSDYIYGTYDSQITLNEKQFICSVVPGEFNTSTNPSAITASFTGSYNVINKNVFDFSNLDIVLRYINSKLTSTRAESWWNILVEGDVQNSIFGFFSSSMDNYTDNRLTDELKCQLANKDYDVNKDGKVSYDDAYMIWNYFIEELTVENYSQYITPTSKRKNYNDIISFLDLKTAKTATDNIKSEFFNYNYSSSIDPTGSYLAPYITQVGLYANADLVAIGKIASPIKNNGEIPINIVVKWDT